MDDIRVCSNNNVTRDKISFEIQAIQNITPMYAKKMLEKKYVNKLCGNLYVTGIDQVVLSSMIYQHPNDQKFVIDVTYSLVGVVYFKNMKLAFSMKHIINVNGIIYFQKGNVFAIINNLEINEEESTINGVKSPILVVRVLVEPNFYPDVNVLRVGLICELDRIVEETSESQAAYNI